MNKDKFRVAQPREADRHLEYMGLFGVDPYGQKPTCVYTHTPTDVCTHTHAQHGSLVGACSNAPIPCRLSPGMPMLFLGAAFSPERTALFMDEDASVLRVTGKQFSDIYSFG